jgi:hypothetical protein
MTRSVIRKLATGGHGRQGVRAIHDSLVQRIIRPWICVIAELCRSTYPCYREEPDGTHYEYDRNLRATVRVP